MRFPKVSSSFSFSKKLTSTTPSKDPRSAPVGAGTSQVDGDEYFCQEKFNKWIEETKHKIPRATPLLRREAFLADPLIRGTIYPYLQNVLLKGFSIQTKDNKLYTTAIEEIEDYLESIELMQVFREDFLNFAILDGHSYRRMDPDIDLKNVAGLGKIEPSSVVTYSDPWDSTIVAYHQNAKVKTSWSSSGTTQTVDSWFIPFAKDVTNIYATYIQGRTVGNDKTVLAVFDKYKADYSITDTQNLRIAAAERIIAMHKTKTQTHNYDNDSYDSLNNPAPIDSVLLAIWLKRLLLSNAPHLIYIVINPFLHAKSGIIKEVKDAIGNTSLISSIPQRPSTSLQAANPELYNSMLQNYENWVKDSKKAANNIIDNIKNGGVFLSGPDLEIKPVESTRNVSYQFIRNLIDQLNEEIGQAFGFPMALVQATGTELASSRNILQIFNTVHAGERTEYEAVADKLIKQRFSEQKWTGTTLENDKEVQVTYSFEDIKAHFTLNIPDTKDLLTEAQATNTQADTLIKVKSVGASQDDLQALGEEYGFGLLGLDNFDAATTQQTNNNLNTTQAAQINAILKSMLFEVLQERGIVSASPTDPSNFKDQKITKQLQEAYQTAKETIDQLFEEE